LTRSAGNAGSNTAADHIRVFDQALAQLPDQHRYGTPILVRADGAGCTKAFLARARAAQDQDGLCVLGWLDRHRPGARRDRAAAPRRLDRGGGHRREPSRCSITSSQACCPTRVSVASAVYR
jgi:hypothetical protein